MEQLMFKINSLLLLISVSSQTFAASNKNEVFYEDGAVATACGVVSSVVASTKSTKHKTLITFGPTYPDHAFSIIIPDEQLKLLEFRPDSLQGKRICVTGIVEKYKGKAQIELKNANDLKLD
jgi:hypothetical protein